MIELHPFDTLFFRDSKPFTMGDDSTASGIFPPYPSTVFGALRRTIFVQNSGLDGFIQGDMQSEIGTPEGYDENCITLKGLFLSLISSGLYFPTPFDLIINKDRKKEEKAYLAQIINAPPFESNLEGLSDYVFSVKLDNAKREQGYYLDEYGLRTYLTGPATEFALFPERMFCTTEYKTGIKKDAHTGTTQEGFLYRAGMRRLTEECRLVCDVRNVPSLAECGALKLGGEGRVVRYKDSSCSFPEYREAVIQRMKQSGRFKLYFVTPAIFEGGTKGEDAWKPDEKYIRTPDMRCTLLTAAIGQPLAIGGWQIRKNGRKGGGKPMMKAVPAGSVYYYQIESGDPEAIFKKLNYQNLSMKAQEGFGLALVGGV